MRQTTSEALFESFLRAHGVPFERVAVVPNAQRPDYEVRLGEGRAFFEVKELAPNPEFDIPLPGEVRVRSLTVGEHLRRLIKRASKQVKHGAREGVPSVLIVYNAMDPMQLWGTERHDFEAAMYGALTVPVDPRTGAFGGLFHGRDKSFTEAHNTSFAALGHLCDRRGAPPLTLYENYFAKFPLPYDAMPPPVSVVRAVRE